MDDSKQIIANLQAENAHLKARIAELEQESFAEYTEFYEQEHMWKLHQCCVLENIKSLIATMEHIAPNYMLDNAKLKARIAELEKQSGDKELTANSKKAVTKLLYALLKEHEYELGAKKGATNDILESLTNKHGVKIARETIAKWLDEVNNLEK